MSTTNSTSTHFVINLTANNFDGNFIKKSITDLNAETIQMLAKEQIGLSVNVLSNLNDLDYLSEDQMDRLVKDIMENVNYFYSDCQDNEMLANENKDNITIIIPNDGLFIAHLSHKIAYEGWRRFSHLNICIQRLSGFVRINA